MCCSRTWTDPYLNDKYEKRLILHTYITSITLKSLNSLICRFKKQKQSICRTRTRNLRCRSATWHVSKDQPDSARRGSLDTLRPAQGQESSSLTSPRSSLALYVFSGMFWIFGSLLRTHARWQAAEALRSCTGSTSPKISTHTNILYDLISQFQV